MGSEQIILANGRAATFVASHTLTPINDGRVKLVPVPATNTKVVVFLVGGAGDKKRFLLSGPNYNILPAQAHLINSVSAAIPGKSENLSVEYLGYYEIFGEENVDKYVIPSISGIRCKIYIVGHSLGGWNGAHLSSILSAQGYRVRMLVTIDPVGESSTLEFGSKIYSALPTPVADRWINVKADPSSSNVTDFVAWMGEKWEITSGPEINITVDTNHAEANIMLSSRLGMFGSAYQIITADIVSELSK